jgi:TorA maturation chaperone TorD
MTVSIEAQLLQFAGRCFLSANHTELMSALSDLEESRCLSEGEIAEWRAALSIDPLEIEKEYVRLFLNPSGSPCPPWQSVHGDDPALMGASHHSALDWYRKAGMAPRLDSEPADHIGLLLNFLAHMLGDDGSESQIGWFVEAHLQWIPAFCQTLEKETRLEFYRLLAKLTADAILL